MKDQTEKKAVPTGAASDAQCAGMAERCLSDAFGRSVGTRREDDAAISLLMYRLASVPDALIADTATGVTASAVATHAATRLSRVNDANALKVEQRASHLSEMLHTLYKQIIAAVRPKVIGLGLPPGQGCRTMMSRDASAAARTARRARVAG